MESSTKKKAAKKKAAKKKATKKKAAKKKVTGKLTKKKTATRKDGRISSKQPYKEEKKSEVKFLFGSSLRNFLIQADALAGSLSMVMQPLKQVLQDKGISLQDFLKKIPISKEGEKVTFTLSDSDVPVLFSKMDNINRINTAMMILPRAFLVSAVSQYDAYLASLIRDIYKVKPETLNLSVKTLKISEILNYSDIDEIKNDVIEDIIDQKLREDHKSQIDWLRQIADLKIDIPSHVYPYFLEIMQRRNLYVHCDGIVNKTYIDNCKLAGYELSNDIKFGDKLDVTPAYFLNAIGHLSFIAMFLRQILWRKLVPLEIKSANDNMIVLGVNAIVAEHYELANNIFDTLLSKEFIKDLDNKGKLICYVNKAQILKWTGHEDAMHQYIEEKDWSGCGSDFNLALAVLKNNFEDSVSMMKSLSEDTMVIPEAYRSWPLFKEFRKTNIFKKTYKEVYGREFNEITLDEPFIKSLVEQVTKKKNIN